MNHYPDGYQYGQDGSNMQGMGYGSYRDPTTSHQNQSGLDYYRGSYPMMPQQMGSNPGDMYGQSRHRVYGHMSGYGHYHHMTPGHVAHHPSMMGSYYGSSGPTSGPAKGHSGYNHPHAGSYQNPQQHRMVGPVQPSHSAIGVNPGKYQGHVQAQPHVQAPPHPMRQPNAQQNPQEVADNILQMASAYPSNQTVQVPLKNRPAPYHIPRSPHYTSRPELAQHNSPSPQQHLQPSPVSSPSSAALRSPSASQCSPSHAGMAYNNQTVSQDSSVGGLEQIVHPSNSPHFSPNAMVSSPAYSPHSHVHHLPQQNQFSNHRSTLSSPGVNSSSASNISSPNQSGHGQGFTRTSASANNPLMSLEKLVMLPETQVVDPKSVVSDSCLSQPDEVPKNVEDPAEGPVESSGHSVGSSVVSCSQDDLTASACGTSMISGPQMSVENSCDSSITMSVVSSNQQFGQDNESSVVSCKSLASSKVLGSTCSASSSTAITDLQDVAHSFGQSIYSFSSSINDSETGQPSSNISFQNFVANSQASSTSTINGHIKDKIESLPLEPRSSYPTIQREEKCIGEARVSPVLQESVAQTSTPNYTIVKELPSGENLHSTSDQSTNISGCTLEDTNSIGRNEGLPATDQESAHFDMSMLGLADSFENHSKQSEISPVDTVASDSKCGLISESSIVTGKDPSLESNSEETKVEIKFDVGAKVLKMEEDSKCSSSDALDQVKAESEAIIDKSCHTDNGLSCSLMENKLGMHEDTSSRKDEMQKNLSPENGFNPKLCKDVIFKNKEESFFVDTSKNVIVKDEVKYTSESTQLPAVLSEMPVIINGIDGLSPESKEDLELSSVNGVDKFHNGITTVVKSKIMRPQKVQRHGNMIPCSVAVGACERSVCDGFVFRHNGVRRVTRSSGIRHRCDSTGNADSDESLENISTSTVFAKEPQDGSRKRVASSSSKRNGFSKSNSVVVSSARKSGSSINNGAKSSNGKKNYRASYSSNAVGSDEEPCYYEGVDSSYDVFLNSYNSDDSRVSDEEMKNGAVGASKDKKGAEEDTNSAKDSSSGKSKPDSDFLKSTCQGEGVTSSFDTNSSPPAKKQRGHSCNQTPQGKSEEVIDLTLESNSPVKSLSTSSIKQQASHSDKFCPSILARRSPAKYPVVVLDKSAVISPKILVGKQPMSSPDIKSPHLPKLEFVPPIKTEEDPIPESKVSLLDSTFDSPGEKAESDTVSDIKMSTKLPVKKKKRHVKKVKRKGMVNSRKKGPLIPNEQPDVKDSFKSMKFSRTLDLMKSNKRRESGGIGPFVRITGTRSSPKSVSVFSQPTSEQPGKPFSSKKGVSPWPTGTTTSYIVSDFPGGGLAMVPLQRAISVKPWVCVFCGKHSSYKMLGDLFGPYFKESEAATAEKIALEESRKVAKDLTLATAIRTKTIPSGQPSSSSSKVRHQDATGHRKQRRKSLTTQVVDEDSQAPEELWVHQACALWTPGVCLVGNKIYGLEECAKDANENICSLCGSCGATLGCLQKGCQMKYHFACAVESDCHMEEEKFAILCQKHKERKLASTSSSSKS